MDLLYFCFSTVCGLILFSFCSLSGAVDVKVLSTKPVGSSGDNFQLKGRCKYKMVDRVDAAGARFTIHFDKDTTKFKSNKVIVLTSNSTTYHVTNKKQIKKFTPVFTVQYTGTDAPSGTCSELQIITTCPQGSWGDNCKQTCSCVEANTDTCNPVDGVCSCKSGWGGDSCNTNINECNNAAIHNCPGNSTCQNTDGSFFCQCNVGFSKASDRTCQACLQGSWGDNCTQTCSCVEANTDTCNPVDGVCSCKSGWGGESCNTDINECNNAAIHNCPGNSTCQNTDGSFFCQCNVGFSKADDGTCQDESSGTQPVRGKWASWESWTACSVTCGSGVHVRYRSCNNTDCDGQYIQTEVCTAEDCPVYGKWTTWSQWGSCDTSCGGGSQLRSRHCQKVSSSDINCYGDSSQQQSCNEWSCPDCGKSCAVGTLNEACDTCVCESTVIEGRVLTTYENPVGYAVFAEASAPSKIIAESNSTGFFALNATCLTSTVIVSREGFQDAVVEITKTNHTVYLELEVLPQITEQPQSKYRITGEDVVFCCAAMSSPAITYYEWFHDSVLLDNALYINNGTGLELANVQPSNSGKYTCRANNAERAILSTAATLSVKDTEDEFCIDALKQKKINLPSTCVQPGTGSTLYEVGDCMSKTCRQEGANETRQCSDSSKSCCVPSRFETKSINCSDYELQLIIVKACACGTCNEPSIQISGKVVSAESGSTIKYAEVWLNGEFETFTSGSGSFYVFLTKSVDKAVVTVKDTYNKYLETTKVIRIPSGMGEAISVTIQMLEKSNPVIIDSTDDSVLTMETTKNASADRVALLDIPADSFYRSDGTKFSGMVTSTVTFIDPTDDNVKDAVPGVFQFIDEEGTTMDLASKGVFNMQFEDENGKNLYVVGIIEVRFPENYDSNFTLWKLNKASGIWEPLTPSILTNKRKRRQSVNTIGAIDMSKVESTNWFNIDRVMYLSNVCYFKTRIYNDKHLSEEIHNYHYIMEMRFVQDNTLEAYRGDFPNYPCFAAPCENNVGYVSLFKHRVDFIAAEPLMNRDPLTYTLIEEEGTIGIIMQSSEFGPFYTDKAVCEASEIDKSHLRFRIAASPEVFTALVVSPTPTRDLRPDSPEFKEMQKKAWYPNRESVFTACFIKVKVDVQMSDSTDSTLKFYVSSFGLQGLIPEILHFLFGIREFEVDIASGSGFYCIEYKCSGTLEDTDVVDYTLVKIALLTSTSYRCQIQEVKDSLTDYPFGEYGARNAYLNNLTLPNRDYFNVYAPTDYGGSYGVYDFTTDNQNDPKNGREQARYYGYEECMGSHVVHEGGAAVHISCQVPDKR